MPMHGPGRAESIFGQAWSSDAYVTFGRQDFRVVDVEMEYSERRRREVRVEVA